MRIKTRRGVRSTRQCYWLWPRCSWPSHCRRIGWSARTCTCRCYRFYDIHGIACRAFELRIVYRAHAFPGGRCQSGAFPLGAGWTGISNDYLWPANRLHPHGARGGWDLVECHSTLDHWSMFVFIDVGWEQSGAAECAPSRRDTSRRTRDQDCRTAPTAPPHHCTDRWGYRYRPFCLLPTLRSESLRESAARHQQELRAADYREELEVCRATIC